MILHRPQPLTLSAVWKFRKQPRPLTVVPSVIILIRPDQIVRRQQATNPVCVSVSIFWPPPQLCCINIKV